MSDKDEVVQDGAEEKKDQEMDNLFGDEDEDGQYDIRRTAACFSSQGIARLSQRSDDWMMRT